MVEVQERRAPLWRRPLVVGPVVAAAVVAAALASTTFVPAGSVAQAADTAVEYADENYESAVVPAVQDAAQPLDELVAALVADPDAAGEEFGSREDEGKPWSFATQATGTVVEGEFGEVGLQVEGIPEGIAVGVAIPPFGSNTALRDAGTDLTFGDFVNQTEFQNVAIELNNHAVEAVYGDLDPQTLIGQTVDVVGAFTWVSKTGGDVDHLTVVPVQIEAAS
jgi:predicted lipoprotein